VPDRLRWTGNQYRTPDGRFISRAAVRRSLEESLANLVRRTDTLADDLRAGRISLNEFRAEMKLVVKQTQLAAQQLAVGGRAQMTQADYGKVGQRVRVQYEFLENWVRQIRDGAPVDNRMEPRARMYLTSARGSFLATEAEQMAERGFLARNVLNAAESCAECIAETNKGLVPVSHLSLPGTRTCRSNCRCVLKFERAA
jgi:hypothetical protein